MTDLNAVYDVDCRTGAFENHERGVLVAMAGPGTGKTFSLLKRIAALTAREQDIRAICYLTFIKEISNAFLADYAQEFGEDAPGRPRISTLHGFGCRLLRNQGFRIGYDGHLFFDNVAQAKKDVSETFLVDLLPLVSCANCRTVPQLREILEVVKKAWRDASDVDALPAPTPGILRAALELLRCYRLVDLDQTIPLGHGVLKSMDPIPKWISEIKHYLVDEYQDFNRAEQDLLGRLLSYATSGVVVGDDAQSIYSSRGGSPEGMRSLYDSMARDTVSLEKCYRCKSTIVQAANAFQQTMRREWRPMVTNTAGGEILCYRFKSSKAELAFLKEYLTACIAELPEQPKPKDRVVCLFPSKKLLSFYFDNLCPHMHCLRKSESIVARRRWLQRVFGLIHRTNQRFTERLLLNEYPDLKPRHRGAMVKRVLERDISPSQALSSLLADDTLEAKAETAARSFVSDCDALSSRDPLRIEQVITSYLGVNSLVVGEAVNNFLQSLNDGQQEDEVSAACDSILPETAAPQDDPRAVQFLTMHGSKGLTRKNVILPGLEDAWLPGPAEGESLEEQRRLFFVALTRATDRLLITFPRYRGKNDPLNYDAPGRGEASTFLAQAGLRDTYHD